MKSEELFSEFPSVTKKEWEKAIEKELSALRTANSPLWGAGGLKSFDSLIWKTEEGFDIAPFYTKEDIRIPAPGQPFRSKSDWEIREDFFVDNVKSSNAKALDALNRGTNSLNFILSESAVNSKKNLEILLKDILPEFISINFTVEENPIGVFNWFKEIISDRKTDLQKISGSLIFNKPDNKIFHGETIELVKNLSGFSPFFRCITMSSLNEKPVTKQIASALIEGKNILQNLVKSKISMDDAAARIQFSFPVSDNYFFEIAKIRAMRILWARIVGQFKPKHECSLITFIHSEIFYPLPHSPFSADKYDRFISYTSRIMSAAIGGADSISINSEDEFSQRINRNIQLIAKEESYLNLNADISSGAFYIETLTEKITEKVCSEIPDCFQ